MAQYELSRTLAKFLDRHLIFPLLEFLQDKGIYREEDIMQAKITLLEKTNMVDFAMDIYKDLHQTDEVPAHMLDQRQKVVADLRRLQKEVEPIITCLSNPGVIRNFRQDRSFNVQYLMEEERLSQAQIDTLYEYARFQFQIGNYSSAAELLQAYKPLCTNPERNLQVLWGKLAADTLMQDYEAAMEDLNRLREALDNQFQVGQLQQLEQRTWLMHWALHVYWNHENGRNALIELYTQPLYMTSLQVNAHHLLRYLTAAVLVTKRRRNMLKEVIKLIMQEAPDYSDPITQFVQCLFVDYDFDGAQQKLHECEAVIENDYFLAAIKDEFVDAARLFIFETYCRIHQCIDITMLAERLGMDLAAAEKWIANLILNARLNAKIDSKAGTVVMGTQSRSIQEQLIDKAKQLSTRTLQTAHHVIGVAPAARA